MYSAPPLFKPYDRTSKEFRRRSVDATLILGSPQDVQPTDPVFIIRRAAQRLSGSSQRGPLPIIVDELALQQQQQVRSTPEPARPDPPTRSATAASTASGLSTYATPAEELDEEELLARAASPQATRQEIIAAQRAVSRANQRAIVSAQKNTEQGVDIVLPDRGMIRSSRTFANDRVRYSYIDQDGSEMDISDIVENEWAAPEHEDYRSSSRASELTVSGASNDGDSFITARGSPTSQIGVRSSTAASTSNEDEEEEERLAINALRSTSVTIDGTDVSPSTTLAAATSSPAKPKSLPLRSEGSDVLEDALGTRPVTSPMFNESLQDRLDRVLAKVREDKARGGFRSRSVQGGGSGRASPLVGAGRISPSLGRRSPYGGKDSPSIDQIMQERTNSRAINHGKKPSVASISSNSTDVPSTPITGGSNANSSSFTPNSSSESRASNHRPPVIYRDDFGLETLMTIVDADSYRRSVRPKRDAGVDGLFGQSMKDVDVHPEVRSWYEAPSRAIDDIDAVRSRSFFLANVR